MVLRARVLAVAVVAIVAGSLGVGAAVATVTPLPPVTPVAWPSSTLSAVAANPYSTLGNVVQPSSFDATNWNRTLTANPRALPTAVTSTGWGGKLGVIGRGAGQVGMAVLAFDLGYGVGSAGMNMIGIESNGVYCDISNLFGGAFGCAAGPMAEYVANLDVEGVTPGWYGVPVASTSAVRWRRDGYSPYTDSPVAVSVRFEVESLSSGSIRLHYLPSVGGEQYRFPEPFTTNESWSHPAVWVYSTYAGSGSWAPMFSYRGWNGVTTKSLDMGVRTIEFVVVGTATVVGSASSPLTPDGVPTVATWYRPGHPERPPWVGENPVRTWVTGYECADGAVGSITSAAFREADPEWPAIPQAPCVSGIIRLTVDQVTEGLPTVRVLDWTAPSPLIDTYEDFPECAGGGCHLLLEKFDAVTQRWLSCFAGGLCADWWPAFEADPVVAEESYRCTYSGQTVPLAECKVYAHAFGPGPPVISDPETGDPPVLTPEEDPGPDADNTCPPPFDWTSMFNPWWYFKGMSCALEWAFVPRSDVIGREIALTRQTLEARPPFSIITSVQPTVSGFLDGWDSGCSSDLAAFDPWEEGRLSIPCEPPDGAAFSAGYAVLVVGLVMSTLLALWHMVGAALGANVAGGDD